MTDKTKRILLVDDEESITGFVGYALRKEGFAVDIAANGTEAFEQSTKSPYDLYILDIMLRPSCSFRRATRSSTRS